MSEPNLPNDIVICGKYECSECRDKWNVEDRCIYCRKCFYCCEHEQFRDGPQMEARTSK